MVAVEEAVKGSPVLHRRKKEKAVSKPPPQPAASARLPDRAAVANGCLHHPKKGKKKQDD